MTVEQLHTEHGKYILTCLKLYGVPAQECQDVRQDLYLRLLEVDKVIHDDHVKGFCSKIARDMAYDWLRKQSRTPLMEAVITIDDEGFEGIHPVLTAQTMARWESIVSNANVERIAQALQLALIYEVDPGITAHEVIADILYGLNMTQIGTKHGFSKATVSRWMKEWYAWINAKLPPRVTITPILCSYCGIEKALGHAVGCPFLTFIKED